MDNGIDVRTRTVDLRMDESLQKTCPPLRVDRIAIKIIPHDVFCLESAGASERDIKNRCGFLG